MVIGGRGFLGQHVVTALAADGMQVFPTARARSGDEGFIELDLVGSPTHVLRSVLRSTRPTAIINCSGAVTGDAETLADANVVGPVRLLSAMALVTPQAQYIHLGSAAEYGAAAINRSVQETDDPRPLGPYGVTKLAGTRAVLAVGADLGLRASVLRIFNPVGAHSPRSTLPGRLAHLLRTVGKDEPLVVGPLESFRDFVDVRDVAAAVLACIGAVNSAGCVYNIGSGQAIGSRELAERLTRVAGFSGGIREEGRSSNRSDGLAWQQADIARAARDLRWSPRHDLADSLRDLWRYAT